MSRGMKPTSDRGTAHVNMVPKIVLIVAIILLVISMVISLYNANTASVLLNFFSSVIVSWLISNDASEKENERTNRKKQEDLAKVSHRHLGDVEKSALSIEQYIKDFTYDFESNQKPSDDVVLLFLKSLDSRMDDLKDRITSTNRDWYDLLADEVKQEIKDAEDPEAKFMEDKPLVSDFLSIMSKYVGEASSDKADEDEENTKEKAGI